MRNYLLSLFLLPKEFFEKQYFQYLYMLSNHTITNYKIIKIKKKRGGVRTLYEPSFLLKYIQRRILDTVLYDLKTSSSAMAYKRNFSIVDNARPHIFKKKIVKLDIQHFFDSISFELIYSSCFSYFPKQIGVLFTSLCCYGDFLPQGAPTSGAISNLVMRDFDFLMEKYAKLHHLSYTRYSDDMTFSGEDFDTKELIYFVKDKLKKKGFFLNNKKTKVFYQNSSLLVTGLVVNEKINIKKSYIKKVSQEVYFIKKYGLSSHMSRIGVKDKNAYLLSLKGKVNYIYFITKKEEFLNYKKYFEQLKKE